MRPMAMVVVLLLLASVVCGAQEIGIGVTYVCKGEHIYLEGCNVRDTSDTSTCMVAHPDHLTPSGMNTYTTMTRGALKQLLPTCQQPTAKQAAAADAFHKKQEDLYNANEKKANDQLNAPPPGVAYGAPQPPKNAEERAMRRCVSSGRLPSSCTGNSLLGAFGQMLNSVVPGMNKEAQTGPTMAGVFEGAGNWRLDFIDGGVLVNCAYLSPNQESYSLDFKSGRPQLVIATRPKPLVLTLRADGTIAGPGPVIIDGVIASGTGGGGSTPGHTESHQTTTTERVNANQLGAHSGDQATYAGGGTYDVSHTTTQNTYVAGTSTPTYTTFSPRRVTCPALNLSSKGARVGIQTMQTDLLKGMLGGDKGPPTPPGIRMQGIFAASTGFSVQFFPESAILGCGPDAARAYPYSVEADAGRVVVKVNAPDHPLAFAFRPDGALDPGSSTAYQVHGRVVTGQNDNDEFTFAPMEQSCNLAVLSPSKAIPASGGTAATLVAAGGAGGAAGGAATSLSVPGAPLGSATLSIVSGFATPQGAPNPLAGHPYTLLRDSLVNVLAKTGVSIPAGTSPYKVLGVACGSKSPDCQTMLNAVKASAASAMRADANGNATLPGVAAGTYYLMISAGYNNQALVWDQPVQLKSGANSITLDLHNATPIQ